MCRPCPGDKDEDDDEEDLEKSIPSAAGQVRVLISAFIIYTLSCS